MKFDIIFVFSPIQLRRGLVSYLIWMTRPRTNSWQPETHTHKLLFTTEKIYKNWKLKWKEEEKEKEEEKKKRSCHGEKGDCAMCSWLLFAAAAAAGLFFGFFWALLTRQKIKKIYLCLPGLLGESKNRRRHRSCVNKYCRAKWSRRGRKEKTRNSADYRERQLAVVGACCVIFYFGL